MKANKKVSVTCIKNNIYVNIHNTKMYECITCFGTITRSVNER